jgi:hypothetical protein
MVEDLVTTRRINHRVTLTVLDTLAPEALKATRSARGGGEIARQLARVHEVRATWLRKADIRDGITRFAKGESPSKAQLKKALDESADGGWVLNPSSRSETCRLCAIQPLRAATQESWVEVPACVHLDIN